MAKGKKEKKGKGGIKAVEAEIQKGVTKHQALNMAAGAASVKCSTPS